MQTSLPRATLEQLQRELTHARSDGRQVQALLDDLAEDVRILLATPEGEHLQHETLKHDLEEAIGEFEVSHPELTSMISNVVNSLATMGI